jgi:mRNA interferase MazF
MSIDFFPRAGQILVCDFSGFREPEMCKIRPIIVVSRRLPFRSEIVTVIPISTTAPHREMPFVVRLSKNYHPEEADDLPCWAKCDMVMNIGRFRLNGFKVGRRRWVTPQATGTDLEAVRHGMMHGLGMGALLSKGE